MRSAIILATMLAEAFCILYGMFSGPSPGINGKMPWRVMVVIAVLGTCLAIVV